MNGHANYEVLGWFVKKIDIFGLIPITLANGVAFLVLLGVMYLAKQGNKHLFPWDPRPEAYDPPPESGKKIHDEWATKIVLDPATVRNLIWIGLSLLT